MKYTLQHDDYNETVQTLYKYNIGYKTILMFPWTNIELQSLQVSQTLCPSASHLPQFYEYKTC